MPGVIATVLIVMFAMPLRLRRGQVVEQRLVFLPAVACVLGAVVVAIDPPSLTHAQALYLGAQAAWLVVSGVGRGLLVGISRHDEFAVQRGGWLLAGAWVATLAVRFGIDAFAAAHADEIAISATFPLFLGLTLAVQNAVLLWRVRVRGLRPVSPAELEQEHQRSAH